MNGVTRLLQCMYNLGLMYALSRVMTGVNLGLTALNQGLFTGKSRVI
jgi:hypothetical protein